MDIGQYGEDLAVKYLRQQKCTILARNYRSLYGEVDILCREGRKLVSVEVKTRIGSNMGPPHSAVSPYKYLKMLRTTYHFVHIRKPATQLIRIDVISILLRPDTSLQQLKHFKNIAF